MVYDSQSTAQVGQIIFPPSYCYPSVLLKRKLSYSSHKIKELLYDFIVFLSKPFNI